MEDIRLKIKQWGQAIQLGQFQKIADEIKNTIINNPSEDLNKAVAKLLLLVCHAIQNSTKVHRGIDVFNATISICSKLSWIFDCTKFYSALYHIANYLIGMKLYKEGMKLCDYILPGSVFHATYDDCIKVYAKFSCLWYFTIEKLLAKYTRLDDNKYEFIMMLVKYELNFQTLSLDDGCKYLLTKLMAYCEKFKAFGQVEYSERINNATIEYLERANLSLGIENKYPTYRYVLFAISQLLVQKINVDDIHSIGGQMTRVFNIFRKCVEEDRESRYCYKLYEQFCKIFMRPLDQFTTETFRDMKSYITHLDAVTKKYGYENAVKWNSYSISKVMEFVLAYWEKWSKLNVDNCLSKDSTLINILEILKTQSSVFSHIELTECYCKRKICPMKFDINNDALMKGKALSIVQRHYTGEMSVDLSSRVFELAEECSQCIFHLHHVNCNRWSKIWYIVASYIYNIGVRYEKTNYEEAIHLYSLLAEGTIRLNAFDVESSYIKFDNPLNAALHRLSSTHYHHAKYADAMISCALHAYVGYHDKNCKAFRVWTNIKYKYPKSHGITIFACLKSNEKVIQQIGVDVNLDNSDLATLCLREIKGLQEADIFLSSSILAVLEVIESLNVSPMIYAHGVLLLGYHMLYYDSIVPVSQFFREALSNLKQMSKKLDNYQILKGHLKFYRYIAELKQINSTIEKEMKSSKIKLVASNDMNDEPASNIVPAYNLINITFAADFASKLENVLDIWMQCLQNDNVVTEEGLDAAMTVHTVIIAAEYARFYRYQKLEIKAWEIAYDLAKKFDNNQAIVWITGRCILSGHINEQWTDRARNCINKLKDSTDHITIETVAMFKLSLSELYFQRGLIEEAKKLYDEAMSMPKMEFTQNLPTYLLSTDITLAYKINYEENQNILEYIRTIVKGLYTMLTIDEFSPSAWQPRELRLYALDILFKFTNHVALRMNSLVSFREITAHLMRRLTIVQKLGSPLHVAECLKNLCFIDLSRGRLEDCEVKLQGIEHILQIETFEMSMQSELSPTMNKPFLLGQVSPLRIADPVRDVPQNDTSPVLRKKVFVPPNFMNHDANCKCFNCWNTAYQYLVFSCTHIRAQLYASQDHINHAMEHFHGAFKIIRKLINFSDKEIGFYRHHDFVEYVLFIMDFARFLKHCIPLGAQDGLDMALHALEICERYELSNHPVYFTVRELIFEYRFENLFGDDQFAKFMVPAINDTDENKYVNGEETNSNVICETPVRKVEDKVAKSVRRRRTPPLLKLTQASVDEIDDDDSIPLSTIKPAVEEIGVRKRAIKVRPIRRKISTNEYSDETDEIKPETSHEKDDLTEPSTSAGPSRELADSSEKKSAMQTRKILRTGTKFKRILQLNSSMESADESEDIDTVANMLTDMKVSKSSCSKTENVPPNKVNSSKAQSSRKKVSAEKNIKSNGKESQIKENSTSTNTEEARRPSSRQKKTRDDVSSSKKSSSQSLNPSDYSEINEHSSDTCNSSNNGDEIVESSFVELRRSRRVAQKETANEKTKSTSNRLKL